MVKLHSNVTNILALDVVELMLNVLRCHLTY